MKNIKLETQCGDHIRYTCRKAIALANTHNQPVEFDFNGVKVVANKGDNESQLESDWQAKMNANAEKYRNSRQGKADAKRRLAQIKKSQAMIDTCLSTIDAILEGKSLDQLIKWLQVFATHADDCDVHFGMGELSAKLKAAGYESNQYVGHNPDWFNTKNRMGEYIVGQVIACLDRGMPPHPVTVSFCERYFNLTQPTQ